MSYDMQSLQHNGMKIPLDDQELKRRIEQLLGAQNQRYRRLWTYYRNPMLPSGVERDEQGSDRPYRQGQEWGLPSRVTGVRCGAEPQGGTPVHGVARKEVVIENDIGWRIDTMVDFLFGKPITITSLCDDPNQREQIETILNRVFEHNGGAMLLQQLGMLGAVYGFVDVLVKFEPPDGAQPSQGNNGSPMPTAESASRAGHPSVPDAAHLDDFPEPAASLHSHDASLSRISRTIRLEVVEPARALPVLSNHDWTDVRAYVQLYRVRKEPGELRSPAKSRWVSRILSQLAAVRSTAGAGAPDDFTTVTEILTAHRWQRYEDEKLIDEGANSLGEIPLVHIQNLAVPFQYSGTSDVEQLAPLQDELNTRLCDRANRITMQSFKMYLGKGIDGFNDLPVAPGRMWVTDNDNADVIEFGGDPSSPSEDMHITELREAMDKISGVTPIAAGTIRNRVGNLTSAAALRVTMMALLAKTERKRSTFGEAIARMCELSLAWLDKAGLFHTSPDQRRVEIHWPSILPDSQMDRLREAQIKQSLGVPTDVLLRELGYADTEQTNSVPGKEVSHERSECK